MVVVIVVVYDYGKWKSQRSGGETFGCALLVEEEVACFEENGSGRVLEEVSGRSVNHVCFDRTIANGERQ